MMKMRIIEAILAGIIAGPIMFIASLFGEE